MATNLQQESLGKFLRDQRKSRGLTLRSVEDVTDISNAYLSQLENNKIKSPSANILYKLANLYRGSFDFYLQIAGIIEKYDTPSRPKSLEGHVLYSQDLAADEERELLRYLQFLRSKAKDEKETGNKSRH